MQRGQLTPRNWLLVIEGDLEPFVIGPLDEHDLVARAKEHRASDPSEEDGLYALSMDPEGNIRVGTFTYEELEPQR